MLNQVYQICGRRIRLSLRNITLLFVAMLLILEILIHVRNFHITPPKHSLDMPFSISCQVPDVQAPRENAAIIMLARNQELNGAVKSIKSLEKQFNRWFHYPIVFLNDDPWEQSFIDALTRVASGKVQFEVIAKDSGMWGFPEWMDEDDAKAAIARQGVRGIKYGGLESYHHMCRFNSG